MFVLYIPNIQHRKHFKNQEVNTTAGRLVGLPEENMEQTHVRRSNAVQCLRRPSCGTVVWHVQNILECHALSAAKFNFNIVN